MNTPSAEAGKARMAKTVPGTQDTLKERIYVQLSIKQVKSIDSCSPSSFKFMCTFKIIYLQQGIMKER